MGQGPTGILTGGMEKSAARQRREREKRKREEKRWAGRNGPVTSSELTPEEREKRGLSQKSESANPKSDKE